MPCSCARAFTAEGVNFIPRPLGRSGWDKTRQISWPQSKRACSAFAAKGGVPANIIFIFGCEKSKFDQNTDILTVVEQGYKQVLATTYTKERKVSLCNIG